MDFPVSLSTSFQIGFSDEENRIIDREMGIFGLHVFEAKHLHLHNVNSNEWWAALSNLTLHTVTVVIQKAL